MCLNLLVPFDCVVVTNFKTLAFFFSPLNKSQVISLLLHTEFMLSYANNHIASDS